MNTRLIINADDFGFSPGVSTGILRAAAEGVVTNTSVMANAEQFEDVVQTLANVTTLGAGVHLNLTSGTPVCDANTVTSLLDDEGRFLNHRRFVLRMLGRSGGIRKEHLQAELRAQVQRCVDQGLRLTHLDTHQHIHMFPSIFSTLVELAGEFSVAAIRLTKEKPPTGLRAFGKEGLKRRIFGYNADRYRLRLQNNKLKSPSQFWGLDKRIGIDPLAAFLNIVNELPAGDHELMCHPGIIDEELRGKDDYLDRRERELKALCAPELKEAIEAKGISLIRYDEL